MRIPLNTTFNMDIRVISGIFLCLVCGVMCGDVMRKSIVFDMKTPDVFYCPQEKPTGYEKMFVRAKALDKLCEFEGKALPEDYKSDCYNDVDESEYACAEKNRILKRLNPPEEINSID